MLFKKKLVNNIEVKQLEDIKYALLDKDENIKGKNVEDIFYKVVDMVSKSPFLKEEIQKEHSIIKENLIEIMKRIKYKQVEHNIHNALLFSDFTLFCANMDIDRYIPSIGEISKEINKNSQSQDAYFAKKYKKIINRINNMPLSDFKIFKRKN